ncbi:PadR family transcriptional regulator [Pseudactinotalea sp. Z1732]|uniref:PadR family transcriptional regulator n=1 Tax=Micrococcales TaxID=85006 RepID=UPI003C7B7AA3
MQEDVTRDPQLLKGVLPMLVLALLHRQESYGYELVTRLRAAGLESITPGTVYPVLTRLEREGRLASRLEASSSGPARKYYLPTDAGSQALAAGRASWGYLCDVVTRILSETPSPGRTDRPTTAIPHLEREV